MVVLDILIGICLFGVAFSLMMLIRLYFVNKQMNKALNAISEKSQELITNGEFDAWIPMYDAFDVDYYFDKAMKTFWRRPSKIISIDYFLKQADNYINTQKTLNQN